MTNPAADTFTEQDHHVMQLAIDASERALARGDMPFGAALVSPAGAVLMVAMNNQNTAHDCTGHAEMVLVRQAQKDLGLAALQGATVYASGEPCAMCAGAMFWGGVGRVIYAASTVEIGQALGGPSLPISTAQVTAGAVPSMRVDGPLLAEPAVRVLRKFGHGPATPAKDG